MPQARPIKSYLFTGLAFLLTTLAAWLLRGTLTLDNFAMLYILLVLIVAIQLGTGAALCAALLSFLCINYFLTEPYYTFFVADTRDLIDLLIFMIVASISGRLGSSARRQAAISSQRAREQSILSDLMHSVSKAGSIEAVRQTLIRVLSEEPGLQDVAILNAEAEPEKASNPERHSIPLQTSTKSYGWVQFRLSADAASNMPFIRSCIEQSAQAIQRMELAERAQASQQYEEADRLKTAILRAVSHDLRTPITVIKSSASNLHTLGDRLKPEDRADIALGIVKEADHLDRLVGNLLDLSRLQAGALTLNRDLNSLEEVAGDVAARVWQQTGKERIRILFPDDMPLLYFDYGLVLQSLSNLVDNALRYEPSSSTIIIQGLVQDETAQVRIINHGVTIPPAERDLIMQPFVQSSNGGHVGLGLPIAKGIVEVHHGQLLLEDTPGGGATFVLVLPMNEGGKHNDEAENTGGG